MFAGQLERRSRTPSSPRFCCLTLGPGLSSPRYEVTPVIGALCMVEGQRLGLMELIIQLPGQVLQADVTFSSENLCSRSQCAQSGVEFGGAPILVEAQCKANNAGEESVHRPRP